MSNLIAGRELDNPTFEGWLPVDRGLAVHDDEFEKLTALQERLKQIVDLVRRSPGNEAALARELATIHVEMERLVFAMLSTKQRSEYLAARRARMRKKQG